MKSIAKEILVMGLIFIILTFILVITFYNLMPIGKVIPNRITYKIPDEVAKELEEYKIEEKEPINTVYELSASDLTDYDKGKVNPFTSNSNNNTSGGNTSTTEKTNTIHNNTNSTTKAENKTGTFFEKEGTK